MSSTTDDVQLSVREAAGRVQRSEETIRRWIWSGKLPARKVGRAYQVRERDLTEAAAGIAATREPEQPAPTLGEWLEEFWRWRESNGIPPREGAGQLVVEDRAERAERWR